MTPPPFLLTRSSAGAPQNPEGTCRTRPSCPTGCYRATESPRQRVPGPPSPPLPHDLVCGAAETVPADRRATLARGRERESPRALRGSTQPPVARPGASSLGLVGRVSGPRLSARSLPLPPPRLAWLAGPGLHSFADTARPGVWTSVPLTARVPGDGHHLCLKDGRAAAPTQGTRDRKPAGAIVRTSPREAELPRGPVSRAGLPTGCRPQVREARGCLVSDLTFTRTETRTPGAFSGSLPRSLQPPPADPHGSPAFQRRRRSRRTPTLQGRLRSVPELSEKTSPARRRRRRAPAFHASSCSHPPHRLTHGTHTARTHHA